MLKKIDSEILNYKDQRGTRIINLHDGDDFRQVHISFFL
ncbi:hypothetical protein OIU79_030335 [Salix purpurea]|uniref:Uncharacterized protein n=1 Tax=Salix purpurea TaxID=77065 RepID=A0A9Q0V8N0_SALPP|nr:hypothetical protein OIU79_030335 [Salix purpurea]